MLSMLFAGGSYIFAGRARLILKYFIYVESVMFCGIFINTGIYH